VAGDAGFEWDGCGAAPARRRRRLALEYGFKDIDGKQPRPLTLEEV
jgi:hypothetical protein